MLYESMPLPNQFARTTASAGGLAFIVFEDDLPVEEKTTRGCSMSSRVRNDGDAVTRARCGRLGREARQSSVISDRAGASRTAGARMTRAVASSVHR